MAESKLRLLLVKGIRPIVRTELIGQNLKINTIHENVLVTEIKNIIVSLEEIPIIEFVTNHGNLVLLYTKGGLGFLFGDPIKVRSNNIEQIEGGDSIVSVEIDGVVILNDYPKNLTTQDT